MIIYKIQIWHVWIMASIKVLFTPKLRNQPKRKKPGFWQSRRAYEKEQRICLLNQTIDQKSVSASHYIHARTSFSCQLSFKIYFTFFISRADIISSQCFNLDGLNPMKMGLSELIKPTFSFILTGIPNATKLIRTTTSYQCQTMKTIGQIKVFQQSYWQEVFTNEYCITRKSSVPQFSSVLPC